VLASCRRYQGASCACHSHGDADDAAPLMAQIMAADSEQRVVGRQLGLRLVAWMREQQAPLARVGLCNATRASPCQRHPRQGGRVPARQAASAQRNRNYNGHASCFRVALRLGIQPGRHTRPGLGRGPRGPPFPAGPSRRAAAQRANATCLKFSLIATSIAQIALSQTRGSSIDADNKPPMRRKEPS
jgi:hypothetical protein